MVGVSIRILMTKLNPAADINAPLQSTSAFCKSDFIALLLIEILRLPRLKMNCLVDRDIVMTLLFFKFSLLATSIYKVVDIFLH